MSLKEISNIKKDQREVSKIHHKKLFKIEKPKNPLSHK